MKVLIVGAGIGGLSLAAHLQKHGIKPTIVEKSPSFQQGGYVLGLWSKSFDSLSEFHIKEKIEKLGYTSSVFNIRNKNGIIIKKLHFDHLIKKYGPVVLLHRRDFHKLLESLNHNITIRFGISAESIVQTANSVTVTFTNKATEEFDIVVGSDGIHSAVRDLIFGNLFLHYSGMQGWIYMAPHEFAFPKNVSEMWAGTHFFGAYPHNGTELCTIFAQKMEKNTYTFANHGEYLKREFKDFDWIVPNVLQTMTPQSSIYHSPWEEVLLNNWVKGRVVLIGDAGHAAVPATGMGAYMALEDGRVLAEELVTNEISVALKNFENRRKHHVSVIQKESEIINKITGIENPFALILRDIFLRFIPSSLIVRDFEYLLSE